MVKLTSPAELAKENGITLLMYATAGAGKTVACATAPAPLLIAAERGSVSLLPKYLVDIFGPDDPSITYVVPTVEAYDPKTFAEVFAWLSKSAEAKQFQTVFIDPISYLASSLYDRAQKELDAEAKSGKAHGGLIHQKTLQDIMRIMRAYVTLPGKNVVVTAYAKVVKGTDDEPERYGPDMPSASGSRALNHVFDHVWRLIPGDQRKDKKPALQTKADDYSFCKTRGTVWRKSGNNEASASLGNEFHRSTASARE